MPRHGLIRNRLILRKIGMSVYHVFFLSSFILLPFDITFLEEHCCIVKVGLFGLFSNSFPLKQGFSYLKSWIKDPAAISMFMMKVDF